eukprot:12546684-Prorocentrum_lima.AAC.1
MISRWHNDQEPVHIVIAHCAATAGAMPAGMHDTGRLKHSSWPTYVFELRQIPGVAIQGIYTFAVECVP